MKKKLFIGVVNNRMEVIRKVYYESEWYEAKMKAYKITRQLEKKHKEWFGILI